MSHDAVDGTFAIIHPEINALTIAHRRELFEMLENFFCLVCGRYVDMCHDEEHSIHNKRYAQ